MTTPPIRSLLDVIRFTLLSCVRIQKSSSITHSIDIKEARAFPSRRLLVTDFRSVSTSSSQPQPRHYHFNTLQHQNQILSIMSEDPSPALEENVSENESQGESEYGTPLDKTALPKELEYDFKYVTYMISDL